MSLFNKIKEMDKVFSWSFFGFLLAVIFGAVSIYLGFIKENKPSLQYVVTSNSNVLDIKEKLGSLDVLYEGESLSSSNRDLRIITFQVVNTGDAPVLPNYYDPADPIGFSISDGVLADSPTLLGASTDYLKEKTVLTKVANGSVVFSNIILESGDSFEVRALVLYDSGREPSIKAFGKIANINKINVVEGVDSSEGRSFWNGVLAGGYSYQATRLLCYGLLFLGLLIMFLFIFFQVGEAIDKSKRNKRVKAFKDFDSTKISDVDELFFDVYRRRGVEDLHGAYALLSNEHRVNHIYRRGSVDDASGDFSARFRYELDMIERLKVLGFFHERDGKLISDKEGLSAIADFISYLDRKGEGSRFRRNSVVEKETANL